MKVLPFKITKTIKESYRIQVDKQQYFYDILHQHPEIQLTLIVDGYGTFICGDHIGHFSEGDLFLIGPNMPHVFKCDDSFYDPAHLLTAYGISVFFDRDVFGKSFFDLPEMEVAKDLLLNSQRGIQFKGESLQDATPLMHSILYTKGIDRLIGLLKLLKILSNESCHNYLSTSTAIKEYNEKDGKRMNDVFQFTMKNFNRPIALEEVSAIANMSPNAFCRFFKQRTQKTYVNFLNEVRIGNACQLLQRKDLTIAQICYNSGFNNLSHFNRYFKRITGLSPSEYNKKQI